MEIGINSDITKKKSGVIELTYKNLIVLIMIKLV